MWLYWPGWPGWWQRSIFEGQMDFLKVMFSARIALFMPCARKKGFNRAVNRRDGLREYQRAIESLTNKSSSDQP